MDREQLRLGAVLPVLWIVVLGSIASIAAASYISSQNVAASEQAFERDASAATAQIEREIERHVDVVGDVVNFTEATWPGDIDEWRQYAQGRVTGGTHLGFSSTAGFIERVRAADLAAFEARETLSSGRPFQVSELTPLQPDADRLVLVRTGEDITANIQIRGLEISTVVQLLGLELPTTDDGLIVASVDAAPEPVLNLLGFEPQEFIENDVVNTNVIFVQALGNPGEEPLGWVVIPGELGYLLVNAIGDLDGGALNMSVSIPDTEIDGDLGRYEGDPSITFNQAERVQRTTVDLGGWEWAVTVWAADDYGIGSGGLRGVHLIIGGLLMTLVTAVLVELRRRHRVRLMLAEFEVELHRTLAQTDPLTGLLNRQGLRAFGSDTDTADAMASAGVATFFLDLNGFKLINDDHGHAAGDSILVGVAQSVRSVARDQDYVGRLGGDEFVLVCPGITGDEAAQAIARRIQTAIREIDGPAPVDAAIGVALSASGTPYDFQEALKAADAAMYTAKSGGAGPAAAHLVELDMAPG